MREAEPKSMLSFVMKTSQLTGLRYSDIPGRQSPYLSCKTNIILIIFTPHHTISPFYKVDLVISSYVSTVVVIIVVGVIPPSGSQKQMLSLCRLTLDRIIVIKSGNVEPIQFKEIKES